MIGPAPDNPFKGKLTEGDLIKAKKQYKFEDKHLVGLKPDTDDQIKLQFEKLKNGIMKNTGMARLYELNAEDPYYTWEGKIVERSSLKDRELPLVD